MDGFFNKQRRFKVPGKMSVRGSFRSVLFGVLLATCHGFWGWWNTHYVVRISSSKQSDALLAQRFYCSKRLTVPASSFDLNVTLTSWAYLQDPKEAVLETSSPDKTSHHLTSPVNFVPDTDIDVEFMLIFNKTPTGNCSFTIDTEKEFWINETTMTGLPPKMTKDTELEVTTGFTKGVNAENTTKETNASTTEAPSSACLCPCECIRPLTKEKEDAMLVEMVKDLKIQKAMTSCSKRKLSSAPDIRLSSKSIGLLGAFVLTVVFGGIFIGDTKLFLRNARTTIGYLRERYGA